MDDLQRHEAPKSTGSDDLPPFIKIGHRILFPVKAIEDWISQKEQQNGGPVLWCNHPVNVSSIAKTNRAEARPERILRIATREGQNHAPEKGNEVQAVAQAGKAREELLRLLH